MDLNEENFVKALFKVYKELYEKQQFIPKEYQEILNNDFWDLFDKDEDNNI